MAKTKEEKEKIVAELAEKLSRMKSVIFSCYEGLSVKELGQLRSLLKKEACEYLVAKKTLLKLALEKQGMKGVDLDEITGGLGLAFSWQDELAAARLLARFAGEHKALMIDGGILEGAFIPEAKVKEIAKLPSKEALFARLVWLLNAPISGFTNVLQGNLRNLVYALNAIKEQRI